MADNDDTGASAEKAYAKASESVVPVKDAAAKPSAPEAPETQAEAAESAPAAKADAPEMVIPSVKPKAAAPTGKPASQRRVAKPKKAAAGKPKAARKAKAVPSAVPAKAKPAVSKAAASKAAASKAAAKVGAVARKSPAIGAKPIPAMKPKPISATAAITPIAKTKDVTMSIKDKVTGGLETMMSEAQAKAKEAFDKSSAMFGDYAEFAKGNVEAVVESGKILAEGLQDMGTNLVAEGRSTFEAVSADMKDLAAAKSPTDLIQIQTEMFRKNFDSAVAYGSKNTEAMIKIATEAMAPISSRVSLAVEKVRQTAI